MLELKNVKPVDLKVLDRGILVTLEIDQEAVNHVRAFQDAFKDEQPLDRKIAEMMQVALVKFAWGRKNAIL